MQSDSETKQNYQDEENHINRLFKSKRKRRGPAERMWAPLKLKLDENYVYITKNFGLRFLYYFTMFIGMPFVYIAFKIRWGFRVIDKQNMKLIRKKAAVIVANHVHNLDSFMLTYPFYPNSPYIVALKHNFEAFLIGGLVRVIRGVPLPEDMENFTRFSIQINQMLQHTTKRLLIYPEGEILTYSRDLRPFKKGAFYFAVKNNVPILPMVLVFPKKNRIELIIGKPIVAEDNPEAAGLNEQKKIGAFKNYTHNIMQKMLDDYYISHNINT